MKQVYQISNQHIGMKIEEQNPYYLQMEALRKLKQVDELINSFKLQLSQHVFGKQKRINVEIPKQLKQKCMASLKFNQKAVYTCVYCSKQFDDGRRLGGHISKAHKKQIKAKQQAVKDSNSINYDQIQNEIGKKLRKQQENEGQSSFSNDLNLVPNKKNIQKYKCKLAYI